MHMPITTRNAPKPPPAAKSPAAAKDQPEFDLERLVYDPAYRKLVRNQLNRAARIKPADTSRG
jgi:hypothetical protein